MEVNKGKSPERKNLGANTMRDGRDSEQSDKNSEVLRKSTGRLNNYIMKTRSSMRMTRNELVNVLKGTKLRLLLLRAEIESKVR